MAEFLNKKKLLEWVPKLIETAGKELVIISPYIQISEKIFKLLKESEKRGVEITLIYKEVELSEKERKKFDEIENLNLLYQPNLHSKCIYNEKKYSSIMFVADNTQSIYSHSWLGKGRPFTTIGFDMSGKSRVLTKNYRTTTQISSAAYNPYFAPTKVASPWEINPWES